VAQTLPTTVEHGHPVFGRVSDTGNVARGISSWLQPVDPKLYWQIGSMQAQSTI